MACWIILPLFTLRSAFEHGAFLRYSWPLLRRMSRLEMFNARTPTVMSSDAPQAMRTQSSYGDMA